MKHFVRQLCSTVVTVVFLPGAAFADAEPDFRTMELPSEVYICESPDLQKRLVLTDEQKEKLKAILDKWKSDERESRRKVQRLSGYAPRRDNRLKNSISDLLDDQQHQLFHQMLSLWYQSPVRSHDAFRFELGLSDGQHLQLQELETKWILHGLEAPCDYRFARHTEPPDRRRGKRVAYSYAVTPFGWQFAPQRNAEWSRILTAAQAKRWKEREFQRALQLSQFRILVVDFSSSRQGRRPQKTGTIVDSIIPYFTPPFEALKWNDEQLIQVSELAAEAASLADRWAEELEERKNWFEAQRKREQKCLRQIYDVMTAKQKTTWWELVGEPEVEYQFLRELKANRLFATEPGETKSVPPDGDRQK